MTAKTEITDKVEGVEYGADDFLSKPFNSQELLARIKTHLNTYEYKRIISERNKEIESEMDIARLIMEKLLPGGDIEVGGLNSHFTYIPMDKVGGDFYGYNAYNDLIEILLLMFQGMVCMEHFCQ